MAECPEGERREIREVFLMRPFDKYEFNDFLLYNDDLEAEMRTVLLIIGTLIAFLIYFFFL